MAADDDRPDQINTNLLPSAQFNKLERVANTFRETFVLPFRQTPRPVYYHRKFARVPTIDQCDISDEVCKYEATEQHERDKKVDMFKIKILRKRLTHCNWYWGANKYEKCQTEREQYQDSAVNYHLRYGELGRTSELYEYYMKQKHRMIWLRRRQEAGDATAAYTD
ncbi:NADH dehydrogenase [ubiquinone] 1 beta subcomplex subunit 10-like [Dreissena polymorpha]|uniref:NADH dehydrogenase [ubiquinone] 1 beta subcomplex subunit 10 n=1 Tax=Dreissena polymorpha TaxID=45954 RepID=A0A9D4RBX6_DREPO|nr:NADH dehydrogenase [ubiquinone] 1 beta subcomplex subunit 10-like [Dreissena polymorpha]KAH3861107.1 hypothetical protein DPMN_024035 [Dreissena polymorpha]